MNVNRMRISAISSVTTLMAATSVTAILDTSLETEISIPVLVRIELKCKQLDLKMLTLSLALVNIYQILMNVWRELLSVIPTLTVQTRMAVTTVLVLMATQEMVQYVWVSTAFCVVKPI